MSDTYTPEELDLFQSEGTPVEDVPSAPASEEAPSQMELDLRDAPAPKAGEEVIVEPTTIRISSSLKIQHHSRRERPRRRRAVRRRHRLRGLSLTPRSMRNGRRRLMRCATCIFCRRAPTLC